MASHAPDERFSASPKRMRFTTDNDSKGIASADRYSTVIAPDRGEQTETFQAGSGQPFWVDSSFPVGQFKGDQETDNLSNTSGGRETPPPTSDLNWLGSATSLDWFSEDTVTEDGTEDGAEDGAEDDASSTVSSVSNLSGLSDISGREWKPIAGMRCAVEKLMLRGISPRSVYSRLTGDKTPLPDSVSDIMLWRLIADYFAEIPIRSRLPNISTLDDVVSLLKSCSKIIVLTGAGVSVSCGIPDFRSKNGVYARLAVDFPDLPDPHAMFDISYFRMDPRPFFKFACEIYPGQFKPSPCHRFIKMLEKQNKLLRNYTQNIDTLEKVAGIENVVECHGSFATATCTRCGHSVSSDEIRETVFKQEIPYCPKCSESVSPDEEKGVMKPDIVFFGEGLPELFHNAMSKDKDECDLLIVIGSSLKVRPVSLIPCSLPDHVPQVLINRERLPRLKFDVELLGDSDIIIDHLCQLLGDSWTEICWRDSPCKDCSGLFPDCSPDVHRPLESNHSSSDEWSDSECVEGAVALARPTLKRPSSVETSSIKVEGGDEASATDVTALDVSTAVSTLDVSTTVSTLDVSTAVSTLDVSTAVSTLDVSTAVSTLDVSPAVGILDDNTAVSALDVSTADSNTTDTDGAVGGENTRGTGVSAAAKTTAGGRHLSLDSSRDSGIGESSNSSNERSLSPNLPQPVYVPDSSYYRLKERCYVFPGAEVFVRQPVTHRTEPAN